MWKWCLHNFSTFATVRRQMLAIIYSWINFRSSLHSIIALQHCSGAVNIILFLFSLFYLSNYFTQFELRREREGEMTWQATFSYRLFPFLCRCNRESRNRSRTESSAESSEKETHEQRHKEKRHASEDENNDASRSEGNLSVWWMTVGRRVIMTGSVW